MPTVVNKRIPERTSYFTRHNFDVLEPDGSNSLEYDDLEEFVRARRAAGMWAQRKGFKIASRKVDGKGYLWRVA